ncbi:MAG: hypothetical protein IT458_15020 [Planctomycetes bacterium]|nr:hypothetical protein [Planctomycetota bacterium]
MSGAARRGVEAGLVLARELVRALAFPLHMLAFLPRRAEVRARTRALLAAPPAGPAPDTVPLLARVPPERPARLFLSAGETSGERHAVHLLTALRARGVALEVDAFGGPLLAGAGCRVLFPLSDRAVMGALGALKSLGFFVRAFLRCLRQLDGARPDLVVLVDYPGFHLVLGAAARRRGIPVLHLIAPQYWAWAPWRMPRYRGAVDLALTVFPFEPAWFAAAGVRSTYIGHPQIDQLAAEPVPDAARAANAARPTLVLLPGSRSAEIELHLPRFLGIAARIRAGTPDLRVVLPHRDARQAGRIRELLARHGGHAVEFVPGGGYATIAGARLALAKSGTGSLEACLLGVPTVVVYRAPGRLARFLYTHYLLTPFFASANLATGTRIVPEHFVSADADWDAVTASALELWEEGTARSRCLAGLATLRGRLGTAGAMDRAAAVLAAALGRATHPTGAGGGA